MPAPVSDVYAVVCASGCVHWDAHNMVTTYKDLAKSRIKQLDHPDPTDHKDCELTEPAACGPHRLVRFSGKVLGR